VACASGVHPATGRQQSTCRHRQASTRPRTLACGDVSSDSSRFMSSPTLPAAGARTSSVARQAARRSTAAAARPPLRRGGGRLRCSRSACLRASSHRPAAARHSSTSRLNWTWKRW
jgi:hypothetical protein